MREHCYGGIDVSKDRLDVMVLPDSKSFSVDNNAAGYSELVKRLRDLPIAAIGIEPSGGYERAVIRTLLAAGLSVRRINPNKLRQFARARGVLAKNDRLDARLIAEYVTIMPTRLVQRDPAAEQLAEVVTMRRQLCDEHVAVENQTTHLEDAMLRRLNKRRLARLEADILLLDTRMAQIVSQPCQSHSTLSTLDLDAGRRPHARLHPHRLVAGTRPDEPQADRCTRRPRPL